MSGLREALTSAYEAAGEEAPAPVEAPAAPVEAVEAAPEAPTEEAPAESGEETPTQAAARARDGQGRFARKTPTEVAPATEKPAAPVKPTAPAPAEAQPAAEVKPTTPPAEAHRAPQSWKPATREHWAKLPPEVQAEVSRREKEMATALQGTAQARQLAEGFERTLAPYRALLTDEPLKVVAGLLQTAAQLQTAPPGHKAALVAQLVRTYGVPIDALDAALAGQPAQQQGQGGPVDVAAITRQVQQQVFQSFQQQREQAAAQKGLADLAAFSDGKEFLEDVREDMADIIEGAARRKVAISLEEAYTRACRMHPDVSKVVQQREAAQAANATLASTQKARAAASSVRNRPAAAPSGNGPLTLRQQLEAAAADSQGR